MLPVPRNRWRNGLLPAAVLALACCAPAGRPAPPDVVRAAFDGREDTGFVTSTYGAGPGAAQVDGALRLLHGRPSQQNVVAFPRTTVGEHHRRVEAQWKMRVEEGADGYAFALLDTGSHGTTGPGPKVGAWEEPNLPGCFAVAFDIYDPPTKNRFDANGNAYGRPQRQVSLHLDGTERENRLCDFEFRDGAFHPVAITVAFVTGGAEVTVRIGETSVYDRHFIAGLRPFPARVCFGARTGGLHTVLDLDDIHVAWHDPVPAPQPPVTVPTFECELINWADRHEREFDLPSDLGQFGRIILRYTLARPEAGWDKWDRSADVTVRGPGGALIEIARVITPYAREWTWHVDVTDYAPLLTGRAKLGVWISTWQGKKAATGFLVSIALDYYPGPAARHPVRVVPLWRGNPEYGDPDKPIDAFFQPKSVKVAPGVRSAKLRLTVTGHGQHPNTRNAAEFLPATRWATVNGKTFEDLLWRTDCWLNPCRPQGGTWKLDRAGWAPGAVVRPWDIELDPPALASGVLDIRYRTEPYVNENWGKANPPHHWVEGQLILYGPAR